MARQDTALSATGREEIFAQLVGVWIADFLQQRITAARDRSVCQQLAGQDSPVHWVSTHAQRRLGPLRGNEKRFSSHECPERNSQSSHMRIPSHGLCGSYLSLQSGQDHFTTKFLVFRLLLGSSLSAPLHDIGTRTDDKVGR